MIYKGNTSTFIAPALHLYLHLRLRIVFPEVDSMAQPLKQTLGFFEMTVFLADNSINDSFVRAMETKYERWLPLVQGPGVSHESVALDDRSGSPDQRAVGKLWQILVWQ